jgi:hypothetical protein
MKITKTVMSAVTVTAIAAICIGSAPTASAHSVHEFGTYERLYDAGGAVVTAWTVRDLEPSRDTVPDYPLAGKLWQAFTPNGISGATIAQGTKSSGKIYFDVTGQTPARFVYNNGVQALLIWER